MVSPEKVIYVYLLHNTITAYRMCKMMMMDMQVIDHFFCCCSKNSVLFGKAKFYF